MISHLCPTIVIKSMCDLMSNNHSYSSEIKGLVLIFIEKRRLQDSCWKYFSNKEKEQTQNKLAGLQ